MDPSGNFDYDAAYFDGKMSGWTHLSFPVISRQLQQTLASQHCAASGTAVDYGCGSGAYCHLLQSTGLKAVGADVSPSALDNARRQPYGELALISDGELPVPANSAAVIFSTEVIEHIEDVDRAFADFNQMLIDDGLLIVTTTLYFPSINTYLATALVHKHPPLFVLSQICAYLAGFLSVRRQQAFVMRWCFSALGGHFHGFHLRQLEALLLSHGFEICELTALDILPRIGFSKWTDLTALRSAPLRRKLLWIGPALLIHGLNRLLRLWKFTANNIYLVAKKAAPQPAPNQTMTQP